MLIGFWALPMTVSSWDKAPMPGAYTGWTCTPLSQVKAHKDRTHGFRQYQNGVSGRGERSRTFTIQVFVQFVGVAPAYVNRAAETA